VGSRPRTQAALAATLGGALVIGALAGCRTDVVVPPEPEIASGLFALTAWSPHFVVVDARGVQKDRRVEISNTAYYPLRVGSDEANARRFLSSFQSAETPDPHVEVHPPFVLRLAAELGPDQGPVYRGDVVPRPGEVIEFDLGELPESIAVDVRSTFDVERVTYSFVVDHDLEITAVDGGMPTERTSMRGYVQSGALQRFDLGASVDTVRTLELSWDARGEGVSVTASVEDPAIGSAAQRPFALDLVVDFIPFFVRATRKGEPLPDVPLDYSIKGPSEGQGTEFRVRVRPSESSTVVVPMESIDPRGGLSVEPALAESPVLPYYADVAIAAGDTLDVEIAPFDLEVEVMTAAGDPVVASAVVQLYDVVAGTSTILPLGSEAIARFGVREGIFDIVIRETRHGGVLDTRRVRVDADRTVAVVLP